MPRGLAWARPTAALVGVLALALPAAASADPVTFQVVNSKGVPQASTYVDGGARTDGNGQITVDAAAGQVLHFTRSTTAGECGAPEGTTGVGYTVPTPVPSSATVTLPALEYPNNAPALDTTERKLLGLINDQRRKEGLTAVSSSSPLNSAADGFSSYLSNASADLNHCAGGSNWIVRAIDAGWPSAFGASENLGVGYSSAQAAFDGWMNSAPHRAAMLKPGLVAFGLAHNGAYWALEMFSQCPAEATARCGLTGDYGDSALDDSGSDGSATQKPSVKIYSVKRKDRKLTVKIKITQGEGKIKLSASRSKTTAEKRSGNKVNLYAKGKRTKTAGNVQTFRLYVPNKGKWKLKASFNGSGNWADRVVKKTVKVK